jgi:rare lipoprotein A
MLRYSKVIKRARPLAGAGVLLLASSLLAACAETEFAVHAAKSITGLEDDATPGQGRFKVGSPYEVRDVWYYPAVDPFYDETGIASWYGDPFHGRATANGEIYDMNAMTAAHKTLPLPTMVRVTNLENGRSIVVRVNDRGPFVHGRIIDMSRRGAQLLSFDMAGTAKVRVTVLPPDEQELETRQAMLEEMGGQVIVAEAEPDTRTDSAASGAEPAVGAAPSGEVSVAALDSPETAETLVGAVEPAPDLMVVPAEVPRMYVQAGAFSNSDNARLLEAQIAPVGPTQVTEVMIDERLFFRVRLGPFDDLGQADAALERLIELGHPQARLIVD